MLRRINDVLPELILNIILYGLLVQIIGIWFVTDKLRYSTGLWMGIAAAAGMAVHMAVVIRDSVDLMAEKQIRRRVVLFSLLRYVIVVLVFAAVIFFRLGNPVVMFLGVMGLKAAAYVQPFTHKILSKLGIVEAYPYGQMPEEPAKDKGSDVSIEG